MQVKRTLNKCDGFTLAELLVVIAIIGIMFAIVLPSLDSITGQSKLDGAANAVHSAAKLARQYAVSKNQPTYLVFNEGQTDSNLAYRAYAVFTINIHTNLPGPTIAVPQESGYFMTEWEVLPTGIVFDNTTHQQVPENILIATAKTWNGALNKNNLLHIQGSTYKVLGYKPSGKIGSNTHWIFLAEGLYNSDGVLVRSSDQGKQIHYDTTGRSRINDTLYDTNGEASVLAE
ncbi:MAG: prepilin-type N-terminal cleavage/methylation domain-containing protein [Pontiella sp.]